MEQQQAGMDRIASHGRIVLTKEIAYAGGQDAGNRAMRAGGRDAWSEADAHAAAHETLRLMLAGGHMTMEMARGCGYSGAA